MPPSTALVPDPVARLNRGLLGLRVSMYAVVLWSLWRVGASPLVLFGVALLVALPAVRHPLWVHRRVHIGVGTSIVLELLLWLRYGPIPGLSFIPLVSVAVASLLLSVRAGRITWAAALVSQAISVAVVVVGLSPAPRGGVTATVGGELLSLFFLVLIGPSFRGIASVLRDLQDQLAERVKSETRLTEIVAEKDRFLEGAAHSLRTPLTGVLGLAEMVAAGDVPSEQVPDMVRLVAAEGRRLARAVDNVVIASRLPMGRLELSARPVDLRAALESTDARSLTVEGTAWAVADPARVATVLGNLVENASVHGAGAIRVEMWEDDERAWFEVSDEGRGVPWEVQETIFDRYETRSQAPTQPASMGLGLPVSRQLVREMGGDLECVGAGNRFRGWLPIDPTRVERAG